MKKIFLTLFFAIVSIAFYAEDLNGFWEAKFGDPKESVKTMMETRGWTLKEEKENSLSFEKKNGTYGGLKGASPISFYFDEGKFYDVSVLLASSNQDEVIEVIKVLKEKYDCELFANDTTRISGEKSVVSLFRAANGNTMRIIAIPVSGDLLLYMFEFYDFDVYMKLNSKKNEEKKKSIADDL